MIVAHLPHFVAVASRLGRCALEVPLAPNWLACGQHHFHREPRIAHDRHDGRLPWLSVDSFRPTSGSSKGRWCIRDQSIPPALRLVQRSLTGKLYGVEALTPTPSFWSTF